VHIHLECVHSRSSASSDADAEAVWRQNTVIHSASPTKNETHPATFQGSPQKYIATEIKRKGVKGELIHSPGTPCILPHLESIVDSLTLCENHLLGLAGKLGYARGRWRRSAWRGWLERWFWLGIWGSRRALRVLGREKLYSRYFVEDLRVD
jgi:hypothetical protein